MEPDEIVEPGPETPEGALETPPETPETPAEVDEALKPSEAEEIHEEKPAEPGPVPYSRFSEVYAEAKAGREVSRKLEQFKALGAEGYYKLYPDEKPKDAPAPSSDPSMTSPEAMHEDLSGMVVKGGKYDGMTLGELYAENPVAAANMQWAYLNQQASRRSEAATRASRLREESEREVQTFMVARAKEAFGKEFNTLSDTERQQVEALAEEVTSWMTKTRRGGGFIEDAFFLMNKEKILTRSKSTAIQALLKSLDPANAVPSISRGTQGKSGNGYGKYMSMNADQLATEYEQMSEAEQVDFLKKAPEDFRKKHPSLPY